jgi:hypothetical protein
MAIAKLPPQKPDIIPFVGGMDLVTTPILQKPGMVMAASNFEPDTNGGYRRIGGYERFDGRTRPSDAKYYMAVITTSGTFSVGDTITGATSAATAVILAVVDSTNLVVTKYSGTFTGGETLNVSGSPQGTITSISENSASTGILHASYKNLAADEYRDDIAKPTGSGAIRGVWYYNGEVYCFRDNAGGTACNMWKATTSGWTQITFGREIQFTGAVGQISEGDTVTGATSGASAVCRRALLRTGTWTVSGVGTLVFDSVTGAFQNGENLQVGGVTKAVASGADTAITLQPGGKMEFDNFNFTGTSSTQRMFFADGVNYIHEFDGTRLIPIRTGIGTDKPKFIKGHKNQLFCAIESSIQVSSIGDPYAWSALTGASEIGMGETITGILPQTGDANTGVLVITTANKVYILYGNDSSDFNLVLHAPNTGARAYTLQNIGFAHFLDNRGITQLQTSQVFGGFNMSILSNLVQPIIDDSIGTEKASCVVRDKDQYRVFFSDGTGLIMQVVPSNSGTSPAAFMFFDYGSSFYCNQVCSFIDTNGTERLLAAGSDGYVYELDVGTSFDGGNIASHFMTVFTAQKMPRFRKRYRRTVLQFRAGNTARVSVGYDLGYGNQDPSYGNTTSMSAVIAKTVNSAGGYWDNFNWDNFSWDASYMQEINVDTPGSGDSIALIVTGDTDSDEPYTIHTAFVYYLDGRLNR